MLIRSALKADGKKTAKPPNATDRPTGHPLSNPASTANTKVQATWDNTSRPNANLSLARPDSNTKPILHRVVASTTVACCT